MLIYDLRRKRRKKKSKISRERERERDYFQYDGASRSVRVRTFLWFRNGFLWSFASEDGEGRMEGRYTRYDVPRVALTWMHLPPFARAIILSARLNATPVYAQVTSSLSRLPAHGSLCPLLSILRVRFMNCTL